jgi:membrane fusion protein (multidrug efflux system)
MADPRRKLNEGTSGTLSDDTKVTRLREGAPDQIPDETAEARKTGNEEAQQTASASPSHTPKPRPKRVRRMLLLLGPIILAIGGLYFYLTGGRYVSTDNAYVRADKLNIATDVSGIVADIAVIESQKVAKDQLLFRLDDQPYRIALAGAQAQLQTARNEIATLQATYRQSLAQIEQARTDVAFYQTAFERQQDLSRRGVASQAALDQAKRDLDASRERVNAAQQQAEAALAQLGGSPGGEPQTYARVQQAQAQVDQAERDLAHTVVRAPMDAIVTNVSALQVGQYLPAAQAGFSLVGTDEVWIEANPKETDLTYMKPGDPATVTVDAYPGREWPAQVVSLSPATEAEFSVLPAQNASGNWVKVVQRIPVRLKVNLPAEAPPLRAGMSADVEIDTGHQRSLAGLVDSLKQTIGL